MRSGGRARIAPVSCVLPGVQDTAQSSRQEDKEDGVTVRTSNGSRDRRKVGLEHARWLSPAAFAGRESRVDPLHVAQIDKGKRLEDGP
jgi:hypothetical protein